MKHVVNASDLHNNTRKAASSEDSGESFLYSPKAINICHEDLRRFQWNWIKGGPIVINNVPECTSRLSWEPLVMWRAFRQISNTKHKILLDVKAIDFLDLCEVCSIS